MKCRRHPLTAMGIVCALGADAETVARRMAAQDASGMRKLGGLANGDSTVFGFADGLPHPGSIGEHCAVPGGLPRVGAIVDAAMAQIADELESAMAEFGAARIGAVVGTSNSTMEEFTDNPDTIDMSYPARRLRERWGVAGPCWAISTACSSSAKAFASARRLLDGGLCDAVVVGGADAYTRTVVEGFHSLEALSPGLTRPLAADRDGINIGEGAAFFLVRKDDTGADGTVALLGVGESSDAYHMTAPDPEGRGAEAAMRAALEDAGLLPGDIDFINLHGTGTRHNDDMECKAVRRIFGGAEPADGASPADGLAVRAFSTKGLTGHCLGAAGAIEAALCWLELKNRAGTCLSNSFAFGGSNASVALSSRRLNCA